MILMICENGVIRALSEEERAALLPEDGDAPAPEQGQGTAPPNILE